MIEKNISLLSLATAVYMDEDGPAVLEFLAILPVEGVDFIATLLKALRSEEHTSELQSHS